METTGMLKKLAIILLTVGTSTLLSSCLVEKKEVKKIYRGTDTLRIYQANDFIDYDVIATTTDISGTSTKYGTMRVAWDQTADISEPIFNTSVSPDLKETTTLTYDENTSGEPDIVVTRYISQAAPEDLDAGSIILHAIDDELDVDYWLYDPVNVGSPSSAVINPVIFSSPLVIGVDSPHEYSVMECTAGSCSTEIYQFNDVSFNIVGDSREITTRLGNFSNPFEIDYSGGLTPKNNPELGLLGDIRNACGSSADHITHNGNMFIMPEIGVIKMTNECQNNSTPTTVHYIFTIRSKSFSS